MNNGELKHTTDWYNDLQAREGKVVDNIRKSVSGNEAETKIKEDTAVQFDHKGLAECSEDELVALLSKVYNSLEFLTGANIQLAQQHLNLIKTELKKRGADNSTN